MGAKRALIVDDSKSARVFLARALEKYDIDVDAAESAEAAIEYLSSNRPDVIFMDHLMPGMDGFQAVQAIKTEADQADRRVQGAVRVAPGQRAPHGRAAAFHATDRARRRVAGGSGRRLGLQAPHRQRAARAFRGAAPRAGRRDRHPDRAHHRGGARAAARSPAAADRRGRAAATARRHGPVGVVGRVRGARPGARERRAVVAHREAARRPHGATDAARAAGRGGARGAGAGRRSGGDPRGDNARFGIAHCNDACGSGAHCPHRGDRDPERGQAVGGVGAVRGRRARRRAIRAHRQAPLPAGAAEGGGRGGYQGIPRALLPRR
ncbi:MAG: response regulator [Gammaproteobacteria bacterium]|nr:MAG: response regulator [Gammaproteobacteria bacterium]